MTEVTDVATEAANDSGLAHDLPETSQPAPTSDERLDAELGDRYDSLLTNENSEMEPGGGSDLLPEGDATPSRPDSNGEQEPTAIAAPASWSKEMHEHWDSLSPQIRQYVSQRELDASRKISEQGNELNRARPLAELLERYQQNFDRHGVTFEQGMESLMNAQAVLDQDPLRGIAMIAQSYGVDLQQAYGPAYQHMDPSLKRLVEHNQALQAQLLNAERNQRAQQAADQRAAMQQGVHQVDTWLTEQDRPYFDLVQDSMAVLLEQGLASTLDEAYDIACHANPTTRQELQRLREQQESDTMARAARNARRKAATNGGNRSGIVAVTSGDMLDDDALAQRLDAILAV